MLDFLEASPWAIFGTVAGAILTVLLHWLAPSIDAVGAGAWLIGIGFVAGLGWDLIGRSGHD